MEAFLISAYNLKNLGFISQNVDDTLLSTIIIRVQDTMIEPILGTSLFKRLLAGITANNLTANEVILLNEYITPTIVAGCDVRAVKQTTYEIRNKTTGKNNDENINSVSESESVRLEDTLRKDFEFYRKRCINYLSENATLYPLYYTFAQMQGWICDENNTITPDKGSTSTNIYFI